MMVLEDGLINVCGLYTLVQALGDLLGEPITKATTSESSRGTMQLSLAQLAKS